MAPNRDIKREKNLIKLMKMIGSLCDVVREEEQLLKSSGYSDEDIYKLEDKSGESF